MTDAARSLGVKPGTYRTWEFSKADGGRVPSLSELQGLARKFGVSWQWLLTGDGTPDAAAPNDFALVVGQITDKLSRVDEGKRQDALRAIDGVLDAFARKAG